MEKRGWIFQSVKQRESRDLVCRWVRSCSIKFVVLDCLLISNLYISKIKNPLGVLQNMRTSGWRKRCRLRNENPSVHPMHSGRMFMKIWTGWSSPLSATEKKHRPVSDHQMALCQRSTEREDGKIDPTFFPLFFRLFPPTEHPTLHCQFSALSIGRDWHFNDAMMIVAINILFIENNIPTQRTTTLVFCWQGIKGQLMIRRGADCCRAPTENAKGRFGKRVT